MIRNNRQSGLVAAIGVAGTILFSPLIDQTLNYFRRADIRGQDITYQRLCPNLAETYIYFKNKDMTLQSHSSPFEKRVFIDGAEYGPHDGKFDYACHEINIAGIPLYKREIDPSKSPGMSSPFGVVEGAKLVGKNDRG